MKEVNFVYMGSFYQEVFFLFLLKIWHKQPSYQKEGLYN